MIRGTPTHTLSQSGRFPQVSPRSLFSGKIVSMAWMLGFHRHPLKFARRAVGAHGSPLVFSVRVFSHSVLGSLATEFPRSPPPPFGAGWFWSVTSAHGVFSLWLSPPFPPCFRVILSQENRTSRAPQNGRSPSCVPHVTHVIATRRPLFFRQLPFLSLLSKNIEAAVWVGGFSLFPPCGLCFSDVNSCHSPPPAL